jgi:hypothetical protein
MITFNTMIRPIIFFIILYCLLLSCASENSGPKPLASPAPAAAPMDGTADMVAELKAISEQRDNVEIWHLNKERAQAIDQKLKTVNDPGPRIGMLFQSGIEWLNAGEYNTAIDRLSAIMNLIRAKNLNIGNESMHAISEVLGVAFLRKAEIENCVQNHNEFSCLIPIEPGGQHKLRTGSEQALSIFRQLLDKNNPDLQTMWLYNIAHMTLGGYPQKVEKEFLINPNVFNSDIEFPRFTDKAMGLGVAVNDISGSVVMDDFNNDHYLDLMVTSYGLDDQLHYFQNNKNGGFDDMTESARLTGLWSGLNMVQADYDNDGWLDVFVLRGAWLGKDGNHPNSLIRNNGDGTFSDVTKKSGLYSKHPTQTATWADFNADGWLDLFIGNEHSDNNPAPCQLYQNNGDGTFKEVAVSMGIDVKAFVKACTWGDYNNDGFADLYISTITGDNYLMKNGGPANGFKFTDVAASSTTNNPQKSFPCWFFDYNQDGWEDIFVSGFDFTQFATAAKEVAKDYLNQPTQAELPKLYKNNQDGTFSDVSQEAKIDKVLYTMGCNFGDLNNDGYPDFYAGTGTPDFRALIPNRMFLNKDGKSFLDVTTAGGFGHLQKGHGIAFGDIDMDGDQDVYNVLGGSYDGDNFMNALFINPSMGNAWIKIKLEGKQSNRSAIGARIKIVARNNKGIQRSFYNTVSSGASFGANPLMIEQGLEQFENIEQIEIKWPGLSEPQILKGLKANTAVQIVQGESNIQEIKVSAIELSEHAHHHH